MEVVIILSELSGPSERKDAFYNYANALEYCEGSGKRKTLTNTVNVRSGTTEQIPH